ncbi:MULTISPECIES: DoxX family protein [Nocardiopsidaceae]|uniref:DoxX family protein n=2 Tax=Nocardiopsidaceae TaxID=83676 RepID=A0ABY6YLP9_9ACTN|nr:MULTISPECIES: DoxX family protein [Nocardiopsaceae]MEE2045627.1 DoxX family protein [Nocardiopsis tropica]MEE2053405.1 DoxX family protein [Nocardiopsis umidischolae]WAE73262.1 DoxX family protein [Streptomonospora nanhaiensis]
MNEKTVVSRISDTTTLLARAVVGVVFIAHGWPKAADLEGTAQGFASLGIPFPQFSALLGAGIEMGAGLALAVGFALPLAGLLLAFMMGSAYYFAHLGDAFIGGYEYLVVLAVTAVALGFAGGRYSLDRVMPWGRAPRRRTSESLPAS